MDSQDQTPEHPRREPIFNLPGVIIAVVGLMVAIHVVRIYVLSPAADAEFLMLMAFLPDRYGYPLASQDLGWLVGPIGYSLLHGDFVHLAFNCLWLVVFATTLARRIGPLRFCLLWAASAVFSAFFFALLTGFSPAVLIGASGVVSATVGAACRFAIAYSGSRAMRFAEYAPRMGILEALTHRPVITFIVMWIISNALVVVGVGVPEGGVNVAWEAHLGGFLFGYLTFALFDRRLEFPEIA